MPCCIYNAQLECVIKIIYARVDSFNKQRITEIHNACTEQLVYYSSKYGIPLSQRLRVQQTPKWFRFPRSANSYRSWN